MSISVFSGKNIITTPPYYGSKTDLYCYEESFGCSENKSSAMGGNVLARISVFSKTRFTGYQQSSNLYDQEPTNILQRKCTQLKMEIKKKKRYLLLTLDSPLMSLFSKTIQQLKVLQEDFKLIKQVLNGRGAPLYVKTMQIPKNALQPRK